MTAAWLTAFLGRLSLREVPVQEEPASGLAPAHLLTVRAEDWGHLAHEAKNWECRWVGAWGEDNGEALLVNACFEREGVYLVARTQVPYTAPALASHTPNFAAANRPERHMQDMLGILFTDHPDARRWTRHRAWKKTEHPLRRNFPAAGNPPAQTPPNDNYRFLFAHGSGVYEIPVGPVHAGIIEPGHFRFQAVGETILNLEERLGYVHKGIEKIAEGRDAAALARLAGRVSGDSTVAHAWAACMAMEKAAATEIPPRALALRAIMAERERVANHLGDIGAICNDVAFSFAFYQYGRLREVWQRVSREAFGHRFMMDRIVPGGVSADLDDQAANAMKRQIASLRQEVATLSNIINDLPSIEDRLDTTGYLGPETARAFGALGYVGRASGMPFDVRKDAPYAPYTRFSVEVPVFKYGDVAARVKVREQEILESFRLIEKLMEDLPPGPIRTDWKPAPAGAEGLGFIEGFRGEILAYVRFGENGRIARYFPRDPSWLTWPTLEKLVRDNIVPDFPVCNKSVNGSYSGHDL
ncbi:hydrogenase [Sulfuricaulis limicola]|uniref:Hydrogenase n=1 Tax=Sulfuricaulis limicola TaxID=1620215 RepID=A0A1B4XIN2_9GAMM|nr:NADH-quinone oxidoreductase subunit C [Sulfuricaulis limicola]BAV34662.1 hydrogenase [Sulfuricaulis limicola]